MLSRIALKIKGVCLIRTSLARGGERKTWEKDEAEVVISR